MCLPFLKEFFVTFTPPFLKRKFVPLHGMKLYWGGGLVALSLNLGLFEGKL
jgi:hypothetical protein